MQTSKFTLSGPLYFYSPCQNFISAPGVYMDHFEKPSGWSSHMGEGNDLLMKGCLFFLYWLSKATSCLCFGTSLRQNVRKNKKYVRGLCGYYRCHSFPPSGSSDFLFFFFFLFDIPENIIRQVILGTAHQFHGSVSGFIFLFFQIPLQH